MYTLHWSTKTL